MFSDPMFIVLMIAAPIAAGLVCLVMPDRLKILTRSIAFLATAASLAGAIMLFIEKPLNWYYGGHKILAVDNLSAFIGIAIAAFAFLVTVYSFGFIEKSFGRYFSYVLMTLGSSLGVAFANDLMVLLSFWGFLGITLYLLVNFRGTDEASAAAKKAMIMIGGTDAVMLFGICIIWTMTGTLSMDKIHLPLDGRLSYIAFLSLAIAAFAKAGVMPFHSWLPDVAEDAPAPVTAYLPASLDKLLGIYLLARMSMSLFIMNGAMNTLFCLVGAVTIVLAVIFALIQHDLKKLLGYHAVSQVGYMVLGIGTGTVIGMAGALFHMINNAIYKSCLFLSSGSVEKKTGTTNLSKLGGLAKYMPITFACFLTASIAISGIPPLNGFVSKWLVYQGIIESGSGKSGAWIVWLVAAMFGSALTLASFMKLIHAVFLGRPSRDFKDVREASFSMSFPVVILAGLCVIFGVFAFKVPIPLFIAPSIGLGIKYLGSWSPVLATVLIIIGILAGLLMYLMFKPGTFRTVETFVGGEKADELGRVSGVEFYDTIKDAAGLKALYKKEENGSFDIYDEGKKGVFFITSALRYLHNGILPTYLVWCLLGMIVIFLILFLG